MDEVPGAGGLQIDALGGGDEPRLLVDQLLQRTLRGGLRQSGFLAGLPLGAELALDPPAARVEAAVVHRAAVLVGADLEAACSVGAAGLPGAHRTGPRSWSSIQASTVRRRKRR